MKKILLLLLVLVSVVGCSEKEEDVNTALVDNDLGVVVDQDTSTDSGINAPSSEEDVDLVENNLDIDSPEKCLEGSWRMTNFSEYLVSVMSQSIPQIPGLSANVSATDTGDLILSFNDGVMTMSENNFVVNASIFGASTPVSIDADGKNTYTIEGNTLIGGDSLDVDVNEVNTGYGLSLRDFAAGQVDFTCSGDELLWMQNEGFTVELMFERI